MILTGSVHEFPTRPSQWSLSRSQMPPMPTTTVDSLERGSSKINQHLTSKPNESNSC